MGAFSPPPPPGPSRDREPDSGSLDQPRSGRWGDPGAVAPQEGEGRTPPAPLLVPRRTRVFKLPRGWKAGSRCPHYLAPTGVGPRAAARPPSLHVSPGPRTSVTAPNMAAELSSPGPQDWRGPRQAQRASEAEAPAARPARAQASRGTARGPARAAAASRAMTQQLSRPPPLPLAPGPPAGAPASGLRGPGPGPGGGWGRGATSGAETLRGVGPRRGSRPSPPRPRIPENHGAPALPRPPCPHMSHRGGGGCYLVIWKSNSFLLSAPSPAAHKEATVRGRGRGGQWRRSRPPGETLDPEAGAPGLAPVGPVGPLQPRLRGRALGPPHPGARRQRGPARGHAGGHSRPHRPRPRGQAHTSLPESKQNLQHAM